jgi:hypothetical protein
MKSDWTQVMNGLVFIKECEAHRMVE